MDPMSPLAQAYAARARAKLAEEQSAREAIDLAREIVKGASAPRPSTITKRAPARSVAPIRPSSEADLKRQEIGELRRKIAERSKDGRLSEMKMVDAKLLIELQKELIALEKLEDNGGIITKAQQHAKAEAEARHFRRIAETFSQNPADHSMYVTYTQKAQEIEKGLGL